MGVIAAVLRRRFVREHLVEGHVVAINVVAGGSDHWRTDAEIADERADRDIDDVVAESTSVRPAPRDGPTAKA